MAAVVEPSPAVGVRPPAGHPAAVTWVLVERAQAGDVDAYGELWSIYREMVERFISFRTNRGVVDDLTSDVFVRGLRRIGSVTWQGRDIGAWFLAIARNLVID